MPRLQGTMINYHVSNMMFFTPCVLFNRNAIFLLIFCNLYHLVQVNNKVKKLLLYLGPFFHNKCHYVISPILSLFRSGCWAYITSSNDRLGLLFKREIMDLGNALFSKIHLSQAFITIKDNRLYGNGKDGEGGSISYTYPLVTNQL